MLAVLNTNSHFTQLWKEYFPFHCELCSKCTFLDLSYSILKIAYHVLNYSTFGFSPPHRVQKKLQNSVLGRGSLLVIRGKNTPPELSPVGKAVLNPWAKRFGFCVVMRTDSLYAMLCCNFILNSGRWTKFE